MLTVGIDIGGTKIAGGVVDDQGAVVAMERVDTPGGCPRARRCRRRHDRTPPLRARYRARGVAAAGFIDRDRVAGLPRPQHRVAQRAAEGDASRRASGSTSRSRTTPTRPAGPSTASAPGAACDDMVMLTMGTGVGGAIIANGALYRGGYGSAAELGHVRFQRGGLPCGCGQSGCIEMYASGRALQRAANAVADAGGIGAALAEAARRARLHLGRRDLAAGQGRRPGRARSAGHGRHGARGDVRRIPGRARPRAVRDRRGSRPAGRGAAHSDAGRVHGIRSPPTTSARTPNSPSRSSSTTPASSASPTSPGRRRSGVLLGDEVRRDRADRRRRSSGRGSSAAATSPPKAPPSSPATTCRSSTRSSCR